MNNRVKIDFDALDRWRATHGIESEKEMCERAGLHPDTLKRIKSGARNLTLLTVEAFYNAYRLEFTPDDELSIYQYV